ncbi:hypothetical protein PENTCL1PPCAC_14195, partial [Pristionchus entomophagus]
STMHPSYVFSLLLLCLRLCSCHPPYHPRTRPKRGDVEISTSAAESVKRGGEIPECYYKVKRISSLETEERSTQSKVGECGGSLRRMADLSPGRYTNLYGSPNPPALVILRGGGEIINWQDDKQANAVEQRWICSRNEHELGWNWTNKEFNHISTSNVSGVLDSSAILSTSSDPYFIQRGSSN